MGGLRILCGMWQRYSHSQFRAHTNSGSHSAGGDPDTHSSGRAKSNARTLAYTRSSFSHHGTRR